MRENLKMCLDTNNGQRNDHQTSHTSTADNLKFPTLNIFHSYTFRIRYETSNFLVPLFKKRL
eukprot:UN05345